jgi:dTDP-4-dehydrorhamnose 3,5-epimerase
VVVDIRKDSATLGKNFVCELSAKNKKMLWIPPGFAHGFVSLADNTLFTYKCTAVYNKSSEKGIRYNDVLLGIDWGVTDPIVSEKDLQLPLYADTLASI